MLLSPFQWEANFAFNILSIMGASVQFVSAVTSLLLGPSCYCSLAEISHLGYSPVPFSLHCLPKPLQTPIMLWVVPPHPANTGPVFEFGCVLCSFGFCEHLWEAAPGLPGGWHGWARTGRSSMHSHGDQKHPWSHVVRSIKSFYELLIWPFRLITAHYAFYMHSLGLWI